MPTTQMCSENGGCNFVFPRRCLFHGLYGSPAVLVEVSQVDVWLGDACREGRWLGLID